MDHNIFTCVVALLFLMAISIWTNALIQGPAGAKEMAIPSKTGPTLNDPNLKAQVIFKNNGKLHPPITGLAFVGDNDILVLEKNEGTVRRIINDKLQTHPLLKVNIGTQIEWGMLGIAVSKSGHTTNVFLYYTEADDVGDRKHIIGNRLYRYELVDNNLVNPVLLLDLPAKALSGQVNNHTGGKIVIGPDKNVYVSIGDVGQRSGQVQNIRNGPLADGTSGILRVTQSGKPVGEGILGHSTPLRLYYAYGIRNSFGFDFDPVTGDIWDTENGVDDNDEINLVRPGFNSGWKLVMGSAHLGLGLTQEFVTFNGNGMYSDPKFVWSQTIGPTDLKFLDSDKLGKKYENTIFIGEFNDGYLYNFYLNRERTSLQLDGPLSDHTADIPDESKSSIIGQGFGVITDIEVGPDGYLYILGYDGTIYRIVGN